MSNQKKHTINLRIDEQLLFLIKQEAKRKEMTKSDVIRNILIFWFMMGEDLFFKYNNSLLKIEILLDEKNKLQEKLKECQKQKEK